MTSNRLFVYGIFLDEGTRLWYGMTNPRYAVVQGYATVGVHKDIVEAIKVSDDFHLTGLIVDVAPKVADDIHGVRSNWQRLDALESGYRRKMVQTLQGDKCWMYVAR